MKNKTITNILLAAVVVILGFGLFQTHTLKMDLDVSEQNNNTITVSGRAEKNVVPDTAKISFYITKRGSDQKIIANYVNKKTKKVIEVLKDLDIDKKDIKTTNYSLTPEYNWNNGKRHFSGYRVRQNVSVVVRDLENIPKVLSKIIEQEVDDLDGPNMFVDNLDEIKDSLREEAIENAKEKANRLANELGVNLDKIVGFSESLGSKNYYPRYDSKMMFTESAAADDRIVEPEINPGEEKIVKNVSITFKIEN